MRLLLTLVLPALLVGCDAADTERVSYLAGEQEEEVSVQALLRVGVLVQGRAIFAGVKRPLAQNTPLGFADAIVQAETRAAGLVASHLYGHTTDRSDGSHKLTLVGGTTLLVRLEGDQLTLIRAYLKPDLPCTSAEAPR